MHWALICWSLSGTADLCGGVVVTNPNDAGPGSLRQAILDATPGETITFAIAGTIALTSGELRLEKNLRLFGPGATNLAISGGFQHRVFNVGPNVTAVLNGLAIVDGWVTNAAGAGIRNAGTLSMADCVLTGNTAEGLGEGGGIFNSGNLTLKACSLTANRGSSGGGINNAGFLSVVDSILAENRGVRGCGGGIYNTANLSLLHSVLSNNLALGPDASRFIGASAEDGVGGGAYLATGTALISDTVFIANRASGGSGYADWTPQSGGSGLGGGLYAQAGSLTAANCTFSNNAAAGGHGGGGIYGSGTMPGGEAIGGAICVAGGTVVVTNARIARNLALGGSGGGGMGYAPGGNGGAARGAGIGVRDGESMIAASSLSEGTASGGKGGPGSYRYGEDGEAVGGGLFAEGRAKITIVNSTMSANHSIGGRAAGGGVWASAASVNLISATVASNTVAGNRDLASLGGGILAGTNTVRILNSIVAGNQGAAHVDGTNLIVTSDVQGPFASQGHNLIGNVNDATGFIASDLLNRQPLLGPLQVNGGSTLTHAPLIQSPAIDAGPDIGTPEPDQRGVRRPQGAAVDIGAVERVIQPPPVTPIISLEFPDPVALVGSDATLAVSVAGSPPFLFNWSKNGVPIEGTNGATLTLPKVTTDDAGSYQVAVSGAQGSATSGEMVLAVKPFLVGASWDWVGVVSGNSFPANSVRGTALDPDGNAFVAGSLSFWVRFGDTTLTNVGGSSSIYVLKLGSHGSLLWAQRAGGKDYASVESIASDPSGNLFMTGTFKGSTSFGSRSVSSAGDNDVWMAKLAPDGSPLWLGRAGGGAGDQAGGIAVDPFGNCFVVGMFTGNANFGGINLSSSGQSDVFVAKYSSQGSVQWARRAGGADYDYGDHVTVDQSGNCYVAGNFTGTMVFDGGVALSSTNQNTPFIASYGPGGNLRWVKQPIQFQARAFFHAIASDRLGRFYVAGGYSGDITVGTNLLAGAASCRALVAKYDSDGTLMWVQSLGESS